MLRADGLVAVRRLGRLALLILIGLWLPATLVHAESLAVAAASDLQAVLPGLARQFERETGATVRVTFGSSGNFFSQIRNGAPFDLFLSADIEYPRALVASGKGDSGSLYTYAVGQLVLWSRTGSGADVGRGLDVLRDAAVTRIAIANPAHAPYGRAAMAAFTAAGIADLVRPKLVLGENVSQAAQFAQTGNATVGLLPLALALAPALASTGRHTPVPATLYPPIVQAAVIVSASRARALAGRFLAFLQRDAVVAQLAAAGFLAP